MAEPLTPARNRSFLLALWVGLYASFALLVPPLLDGPDALHAEVAREILARHEWLTFYANGIPLVDQTPMLSWVIASSMSVFGIGTIAAHFASALFVLLMLLLTEHVARNAFRSVRTGAYASILLLLSFGAFVFTRILIPETIACLWLTAALYCFWQTEQQGEHPGYLQAMGFGAACALGGFTTGFFGAVLPPCIVLVYLLLTRGVVAAMKRLWQLHLITAVVAFTLVVAPWYFVADRANLHGWALLSFLKPHLEHPHRAVLLLPMWMLPWGIFVVPALQAIPWRVFRSRLATLATEQKTNLLLGMAALLSLIASAVTTQHVYAVLPSMPFVAMLIGRWLDREAAEVEAERVPSVLGNAGFHTGTWLLALGSVVGLVWVCVPLGFCTFVLNLIFGWNAIPMDHLRGPMQLMAVAFFAGTLAAWWLRKHYRPHHANIALAAAMVVVLTATHKGLQALTPVLSSQRLAQTMQQKLRQDDLIVVNGNYADASSLAFYLQRENLHLWHGNTLNVPMRLQETDQTMRMRWHGVQRVYVWTETGALPPLPGKVYVIAESGSKQVVSNRDSVY